VSAKKYANEIGWSDVEPHEVIREVSAKCIEIRAMDAKLAEGWKPEIIPGGFAGHCVNQSEQEWIYSSRDEAPVFRIRLGKKGWKDKHGNRYVLADAPRKFHDYNF
jgi:hypothetical protein